MQRASCRACWNATESHLRSSNRPRRAYLYARLPGSGDTKALVVLHDMDVVPATPDEWSVPPFSEELRDGALWGRGILDNKGMGVAGMVAFLMLHRAGIELPRDVILLAVADEEAGGGLGARWLLEHRADLFQDVEFILNEGGAIVPRDNDPFLYSVELAQRAPL
jgi:acetylornithine deacetylase/succinyl-diaminopimelate desuccinylase-like protein